MDDFDPIDFPAFPEIDPRVWRDADDGGLTCSSGCQHPEFTINLPRRALDRVWMYLTWPLAVRALKRQGFKRLGWMTWG